ncbi:MAG: fibronectin type III domain-containing protein [Actinomycetota bacterium]|nr:fibronectin type III domain-containing protein [Actinomycetota bacterium]
MSATVQDTAATMSWGPPASDGGSAVTGYRVSRDGTDAGGTGPWSTTVAATARSFTFTGLVAGSSYLLSVQAINAVGTGSAGSASVTIPASAVLPGAPTSVTATKADAARTATVSWAPPASDGGSAVTGYRVARDGTDASGTGPWSTTVAASARSFTFTNLVAGATYRLSVQAVTAVGTGPAGSASVTLGGRTVVLNPVADTMARQQAPTTGSGALATLLSDTEETAGSATRATPYLRFTVPALAAGESVAGARLSLQVSNGTTNGPAVWRTGTSWSESGLTWSSGQPTRSGTAAVGNFGSMGTGRIGTSVSGITGGGDVSFQLYAESGDGVQFASRENTTTGNRPQLVLTITAPA